MSRKFLTWTFSCGHPGSSGSSNFLLWQSAYAELVFLDTLFPDFDRRHLWRACEMYAEPGPPLRRRAAESWCPG